MNISKLFNPFFSFSDYEDHRSGLLKMAKSLWGNSNFSIMPDFQVVKMEFFFEAKSYSNAVAMKEDLLEEGYEIFKLWQTSQGRYWVSGRTPPLYIDNQLFSEWVDRMCWLGYVNDCMFDGWGMLVENPGDDDDDDDEIDPLQFDDLL